MAKGGLPIIWFSLGKALNHRFTVLAVTALLAFVVLWQAGALVWKYWLLDNTSAPPAARAPTSPADTGPESFANLLRHPLIGSRSEAAAGASADQPRTSLNLKLVGLMYSADPDQARAIIDSEKDGARSLSVHDRVADKVEIYRIEPDRVILLHAGRQEALMLDPEEQASGTPPGTDSGSADATAESRASGESPSAPGQAPADAPTKLADVMRDFSATPVLEAGELVGFRLAAVRNPEIMTEWGIDPDDVITAVNGMPLNSQGRIMVLYNQLKNQREFELTVNRGGSSRKISVDFEE